MSLLTTRRQRRMLKSENAKWPTTLMEVPRDTWPWAPHTEEHQKRQSVWRSRYYLVQVFAERDNIIRLSINRASVEADRFEDGISWNELQDLKRECGYGDFYAIEVFPRDRDIVNVANMRHLWILPEPLKIGWFTK